MSTKYEAVGLIRNKHDSAHTDTHSCLPFVYCARTINLKKKTILRINKFCYMFSAVNIFNCLICFDTKSANSSLTLHCVFTSNCNKLTKQFVTDCYHQLFNKLFMKSVSNVPILEVWVSLQQISFRYS